MRVRNLSKAETTLSEADKETGREHVDAQIYGQSTDTEVTCDLSAAACEAAPIHAKQGYISILQVYKLFSQPCYYLSHG